jgi:hypothetical protein
MNESFTRNYVDIGGVLYTEKNEHCAPLEMFNEDGNYVIYRSDTNEFLAMSNDFTLALRDMYMFSGVSPLLDLPFEEE